MTKIETTNADSAAATTPRPENRNDWSEADWSAHFREEEQAHESAVGTSWMMGQ